LRKGGKSVQEYKGPREADGIVEYLKKQSGPASAELKSDDDATGFIGDKKVVIVSSSSDAFYSFFYLLLNFACEQLLLWFCRLGCSQSSLGRSLRTFWL
jgi:hypothetical protein